MSEDLKNIYAAKEMLHNFFDTAVPVDLFRGQPIKDFKAGKDLLAPDPGGRVMKDGTISKADVRLETLDGKTMVLGCRCIKGRYRGISLGDRTPVFSRNKHWKRFRIPEGKKIPAPLAITKDADYRAGEDQPIH
ncbi:hypothetical protein [Nevskia sp.]|uniref:hypothetical protein n=1 Tax=Nevskia sp. TaxID=1929292 RepID=UPI0026007D2B|nr:hypothetical protein [Nevskia sp.]